MVNPDAVTQLIKTAAGHLHETSQAENGAG